jgi:hypothetical protein
MTPWRGWWRFWPGEVRRDAGPDCVVTPANAGAQLGLAWDQNDESPRGGLSWDQELDPGIRRGD